MMSLNPEGKAHVLVALSASNRVSGGRPGYLRTTWIIQGFVATLRKHPFFRMDMEVS